MTKSPDLHPLLAEIDAFLSETGIAASTFGHRACHDWTLVDRLRRGGDVRRRTEARVRAWMTSPAARKLTPRRSAA